MLIYFTIHNVFFSLLGSWAYRQWKSGAVTGVLFIMITALSHNAFAQFPGVGRAAPDGVATYADDESNSSETNVAGNSNSDLGDSISNESLSSGAGAVSAPSDENDIENSDQSIDSQIPSSILKKSLRRKQLFVQKLRIEFASIELFERETGLPFSRHNVPRFLSELRGDLTKITAEEEKGSNSKKAVRSIALDAHHIEKELNEHLDQLLKHLGQPVPTRHFLTMLPVLPNSSRMIGTKLDALALKFELADYGEKVLQAMGTNKR